MPKIPFIGQTYPHRSLNVSAQRSLNLYPELVSDESAKSRYILIGTPGTRTWADLSSISSSTCRGLYYTSTSKLYTIYGQYVIRMNSDGTIDKSWLMSDSSGAYVSFADNGKYLVFTDGYNMWLLDMTTDTLTTQNDLPFTEPQKVVFIGQRFVSFGKNSNQYWWSGLGADGPLTWDGASFASAEGSSDNIISIANSDGELVLFGPRSYEVHRSVPADVDQPYSVVNGSYTNIGCGAVNSPAEIMGVITWLGSSTAGKNMVFQLQNYNAVPISNSAITYQLSEFDKKAPNDKVNVTSDAVGFCYQQEGHSFYVLNLLQANKTLVYDLSTQQWHDRSTRDPIYNVENRWEPLFCVYAYERILTGNSKVPQILELDLSTYNEYDGRAIKRQRIGPVSYDDDAYLFHRDLIIDMETGIGKVSNLAQGYKPKAMLRWSDDSGHTWSMESWASMGSVGDYLVRVRWRQLGRARNRVYELTITDPVKVILIGCSITAEKGVRR